MIKTGTKSAYLGSLEVAYRRLDELFCHRPVYRTFRDVLRAVEHEETEHRRINGGDYAIPVRTAARLQILMHLGRTVEAGLPYTFEADWIISVRTSLVLLAALAVVEREVLVAEFTAAEITELAGLDYAAAVRGEAWS